MHLKMLVGHTNHPKQGITSIMREYENIINWIYGYEQQISRDRLILFTFMLSDKHT